MLKRTPYLRLAVRVYLNSYSFVKPGRYLQNRELPVKAPDNNPLLTNKKLSLKAELWANKTALVPFLDLEGRGLNMARMVSAIQPGLLANDCKYFILCANRVAVGLPGTPKPPAASVEAKVTITYLSVQSDHRPAPPPL